MLSEKITFCTDTREKFSKFKYVIKDVSKIIRLWNNGNISRKVGSYLNKYISKEAKKITNSMKCMFIIILY